MTLLRQGQIIQERFASAVDQETIPATGPVLVSLEQWREHRGALLGRGDDLGIWLRPGDSLEEIEADLPKLALIALEFPAFTDGRAYSTARIIRERHGWEGELRAVGDVLLEQLHFMDRSGFDVFDIQAEDAIAAWQTASQDIDVWYQPTSDGRKTALDHRLGR